MKFRTVPVRRRPAAKNGGFRLSAVTRKRKKQRASAAAPAMDMDEDSGSGISRALTIIFLIHIVAVALIFVHQRFLSDRGDEPMAVTKTEIADHQGEPAARPRIENAPVLSTGEEPYIVRQGDNYARIAAAHSVDEQELRAVNNNVEIQPGLILRLPAKRIVAAEPPEVLEIREQTPSDQDRGLVEAYDVTHAPKAQLVGAAAVPAAASASGESYVVQKGDSIWRIASRFKVSQDALMKVNGITDPRRMKTGMTLSIPR